MELAALLNKILALVELLVAKWKKADAQQTRNEVEHDPHGWFDTHFNGVSTPADKTTSANKTNADNPTE